MREQKLHLTATGVGGKAWAKTGCAVCKGTKQPLTFGTDAGKEIILYFFKLVFWRFINLATLSGFSILFYTEWSGLDPDSSS